MLSKNGYIAIFLAFSFISPSFNGTEWSRNISEPFSLDIGMALEKLGNGYIAVVKSFNVLSNEWHCRIIKLNENGKIEWERKFLSDHNNCGICILNGIVMLYSYQGKAMLTKISENGKIEWSKNYSFSFPVNSSTYIICTKENILFSVYSNEVERRSIVVKIDGEGNKLWEKYFNHSVSIASMENGYILVETPLTYSINYTVIYAFDANDSLLWEKKLNGIDYFAHPAIKGFILQHGRTWLKFDENGNEQWNTTFEKGIVITSCSIVQNGYLMAGAKIIDTIPKEEGILIKLNENGKIEWSKTYFLPRYNIGNFFLTYTLGFADAKECDGKITAMVIREAYPDAIFIYFPPLFIFLIYLSFIKTDTIMVMVRE